MKATISLKQLRTDPEALTRLLNNGYQVDITKHRKPLTTAYPPLRAKRPEKGNTEEILKLIRTLPRTHMLDDHEPDTVKAMKKAKAEYMERKYGGKR
jgi:hypothetical protein